MGHLNNVGKASPRDLLKMSRKNNLQQEEQILALKYMFSGYIQHIWITECPLEQHTYVSNGIPFGWHVSQTL